ncbi:MAG: ABC transporter substrate-binding protein, partial [Dehalococcoidia bacterium]|nr:ABC transporter substrate-binding protein [Dehalococcoidia bacterium]
KVAFLYLRGAQVQMLAGDGSRADLLIEAAGGVDAGTEAGVTDYVPVTPEALVTANPDILLVMDSGLESVGGIDGLLGIPGIAETTAGASRAVVSFDDQYLLGFGPRTGAVLHELVRAIHPSLQ